MVGWGLGGSSSCSGSRRGTLQPDLVGPCLQSAKLPSLGVLGLDEFLQPVFKGPASDVNVGREWAGASATKAARQDMGEPSTAGGVGIASEPPIACSLTAAEARKNPSWLQGGIAWTNPLGRCTTSRATSDTLEGFYAQYSPEMSPKAVDTKQLATVASQAADQSREQQEQMQNMQSAAAAADIAGNGPSQIIRQPSWLYAREQRLIFGLPEADVEAAVPMHAAAFARVSQSAGGAEPQVVQPRNPELQPLLRNFSMPSRCSVTITSGNPAAAAPAAGGTAPLWGQGSWARQVEQTIGRALHSSFPRQSVALQLAAWQALHSKNPPRMLPMHQAPGSVSSTLLREQSLQMLGNHRLSLGMPFEALVPKELRPQPSMATGQEGVPHSGGSSYEGSGAQACRLTSYAGMGVRVEVQGTQQQQHQGHLQLQQPLEVHCKFTGTAKACTDSKGSAGLFGEQHNGSDGKLLEQLQQQQELLLKHLQGRLVTVTQRGMQQQQQQEQQEQLPQHQQVVRETQPMVEQSTVCIRETGGHVYGHDIGSPSPIVRTGDEGTSAASPTAVTADLHGAAAQPSVCSPPPSGRGGHGDTCLGAVQQPVNVEAANKAGGGSHRENGLQVGSLASRLGSGSVEDSMAPFFKPSTSAGSSPPGGGNEHRAWHEAGVCIQHSGSINPPSVAKAPSSPGICGAGGSKQSSGIERQKGSRPGGLAGYGTATNRSSSCPGNANKSPRLGGSAACKSTGYASRVGSAVAAGSSCGKAGYGKSRTTAKGSSRDGSISKPVNGSNGGGAQSSRDHCSEGGHSVCVQRKSSSGGVGTAARGGQAPCAGNLRACGGNLARIGYSQLELQRARSRDLGLVGFRPSSPVARDSREGTGGGGGQQGNHTPCSTACGPLAEGVENQWGRHCCQTLQEEKGWEGKEWCPGSRTEGSQGSSSNRKEGDRNGTESSFVKVSSWRLRIKALSSMVCGHHQKDHSKQDKQPQRSSSSAKLKPSWQSRRLKQGLTLKGVWGCGRGPGPIGEGVEPPEACLSYGVSPCRGGAGNSNVGADGFHLSENYQGAPQARHHSMATPVCLPPARGGPESSFKQQEQRLSIRAAAAATASSGSGCGEGISSFLDVADYWNCFSPDAASRAASRSASLRTSREQWSHTPRPATAPTALVPISSPVPAAAKAAIASKGKGSSKLLGGHGGPQLGLVGARSWGAGQTAVNSPSISKQGSLAGADMSQFWVEQGVYSSAASRLPSRQTTCKVQGPGGGDVFDAGLEGFWVDSGVYSLNCSRVGSRKATRDTNVDIGASWVGNPQQQSPQGSTASTGAWPCQISPSRAGGAAGGEGGSGGCSVQQQHQQLPVSPGSDPPRSPSHAYMLLHGPSRLSWHSKPEPHSGGGSKAVNQVAVVSSAGEQGERLEAAGAAAAVVGDKATAAAAQGADGCSGQALEAGASAASTRQGVLQKDNLGQVQKQRSSESLLKMGSQPLIDKLRRSQSDRAKWEQEQVMQDFSPLQKHRNSPKSQQQPKHQQDSGQQSVEEVPRSSGKQKSKGSFLSFLKLGHGRAAGSRIEGAPEKDCSSPEEAALRQPGSGQTVQVQSRLESELQVEEGAAFASAAMATTAATVAVGSAASSRPAALLPSSGLPAAVLPVEVGVATDAASCSATATPAAQECRPPAGGSGNGAFQGNDTGAVGMQHLATSMQRIASCLEEFLIQRSPGPSSPYAPMHTADGLGDAISTGPRPPGAGQAVCKLELTAQSAVLSEKGVERAPQQQTMQKAASEAGAGQSTHPAGDIAQDRRGQAEGTWRKSSLLGGRPSRLDQLPVNREPGAAATAVVDLAEPSQQEGEEDPSLELLEAMAAAAGVDVASLLDTPRQCLPEQQPPVKLHNLIDEDQATHTEELIGERVIVQPTMQLHHGGGLRSKALGTAGACCSPMHGMCAGVVGQTFQARAGVTDSFSSLPSSLTSRCSTEWDEGEACAAALGHTSAAAMIVLQGQPHLVEPFFGTGEAFKGGTVLRLG